MSVSNNGFTVSFQPKEWECNPKRIDRSAQGHRLSKGGWVKRTNSLEVCWDSWDNCMARWWFRRKRLLTLGCRIKVSLGGQDNLQKQLQVPRVCFLRKRREFTKTDLWVGSTLGSSFSVRLTDADSINTQGIPGYLNPLACGASGEPLQRIAQASGLPEAMALLMSKTILGYPMDILFLWYPLIYPISTYTQRSSKIHPSHLSFPVTAASNSSWS